MISSRLRSRLEDFIAEHGGGRCHEEPCTLSSARRWVAKVKHDGLLAESAADHELLLMALAYSAYKAERECAQEQIERYQAAIAAFVAKNGGILKIHLDEVEAIEATGGTMTSFVDPDGETITYRIVSDSSTRS